MQMLWMSYVDPGAANAAAGITLNRLLVELASRGHAIRLFHGDALPDYGGGDAMMRRRLLHVQSREVRRPRLSRFSTCAFRVPGLARLPDRAIVRHRAMVCAVRRGIRRARPDVLVSWSQPDSVHLAALAVKRRMGIPWVVCLSDTWSDDGLGYGKNGRLIHLLNRRMEQAVFRRADAIVFTTESIRDLVMAKYPIDWLRKTFVHVTGFDESLYPRAGPAAHDRFLVKYVGALYGERSPETLFQALRMVAHRSPSLLARLEFQFIGHCGDAETLAYRYGLPRELIRTRAPLRYVESLGEMTTADLLLSIDAPVGDNVFLPSKLVDYSGSGTPIWCLGRPGPASDFARACGAVVSDVRNPSAIMADLVALVTSAGKPSVGCVGQFRIDRTTEAFLAAVSTALGMCRAPSSPRTTR